MESSNITEVMLFSAFLFVMESSLFVPVTLSNCKFISTNYLAINVSKIFFNMCICQHSFFWVYECIRVIGARS